MALWLPPVVVSALLVATLAVEGKKLPYGVLKTLASLVFVAAGVARLPLTHAYAIALLVGLVLSLLGDVLLVDKGRRLAFLMGLASFLCAHASYAIAFVSFGVSARATAVGALAMTAVGVPIARWLMPHVTGGMRKPVIAYVVTITAMVILSAGAVGAGARPTLVVGALLFYASDICVARERFVKKERWNGLVGLPLYYAGQLLLIDGLSGR